MSVLFQERYVNYALGLFASVAVLVSIEREKLLYCTIHLTENMALLPLCQKLA